MAEQPEQQIEHNIKDTQSQPRQPVAQQPQLYFPIKEIVFSDDIEETTLCLVHGFVREIKQLHYHLIPDDILTVCAAFYQSTEYFASYGDSYTVTSDGLTITQREGAKESAFGIMSIHSMSDKVHTWTFKILGVDTGMSIGIVQSDDDQVDRDCFDPIDTLNYAALYSGHKMSKGELTSYKFYIAEGEEVKMVLDLKKKELIYHVKDECLGGAYTVE